MRYINIYALLITSLILMVAMLGMSFYLRYRVKEATEAIQQSKKIVAKTERLKNLILDARFGMRGYALSGRVDYLEPYLTSAPQINPRLAELGLLVKDKPAQNQRVARQLTPMVRRSLDRMADFRKQFETGGREIIEQRIVQGTGKRLNDSITVLISRISAQEQVSLGAMEAEMRALMNFSYYARLISALFFIGVISLALVILRHKDLSIGSLMTRLETQNQALAQRSDELRESNHLLEETNVQLQKLNADKNKFLSMAAHDLKNPILAITSLAEHLGTMVDPAKTEKVQILEYIRESSRKMAALIHNLLDYQLIEKGEVERKIEPIDLHSLTVGHLDILQQLAHDKNIVVQIDSNAAGKTVMGDKRMYIQILDNLASNAIKFSPPGKRVKIELEVEGAAARLAVEDEGPGIKPEEEKLLFQEFKKLSARPTGGETSTGLGLSSARKYAELMNANLYFEPVSEKQGARFILLIANLVA